MYHDIVKIIETSRCGDVNCSGGSAGGDGGTSETIGNKIAIKGMVRVLTDEISIRNGKYGDYIFYKTSLMKNPTFLKIKGFTEDYKVCPVANIIEWIHRTYKL
jgi:hypothetical protein